MCEGLYNNLYCGERLFAVRLPGDADVAYAVDAAADDDDDGKTTELIHDWCCVKVHV